MEQRDGEAANPMVDDLFARVLARCCARGSGGRAACRKCKGLAPGRDERLTRRLTVGRRRSQADCSIPSDAAVTPHCNLVLLKLGQGFHQALVANGCAVVDAVRCLHILVPTMRIRDCE